MKKLAIIAVLLLLWNMSLQAQCPPGSIVLSSQSEVDNFSINYPGCQVITGDVQIGADTLQLSNIVSLAALSQIHSITGSLRIVRNGVFLTSLQGLENLESVGQSIFIGYNDGLLDLGALNSISSIGGSVHIAENPVMTAVNAFNNINYCRDVLVIGNGNMNHLNAFHGLSAVYGVSVYQNASLTQLNAFDNLDSIAYDGLIIYNNPQLVSIENFLKLTVVNGTIEISTNNSLVSLHGLDSLKTVSYQSVRITQNPLLTSLTGLGNLESAGTALVVAGNQGLISLEGLGPLNSNTHMLITGNAALTSLGGLSQYTHLGNIEIRDNDLLTDLTGLDSLTELNDFLTIDGNASLSSLKGLGKLQKVDNLVIEQSPALATLGGHLQNLTALRYTIIRENAVLADLNGFQNLASLEAITLTDNPMLSDLSALPSLDSLRFINIRYHPLLVDLDDFNNLQSLEELYLTGNANLSDLSNLQDLYQLASLEITGNPLLSNCSIYPICNYLLHSSDDAVIQNNGIGCNSVSEVEAGCGAIPVEVAVLIDNNGDCVPDTSDTPVGGILVSLSAAIQMNVHPTQPDGWAHFGYLDNGTFELDLPNFPTNQWGMCQDSLLVTPDAGTDSIIRYFLLQPTTLCPELSVELGLPPVFRGCLVQTHMNVSVTNTGTANAEGVTVAVVMPALLQLVSSVPPVMSQVGDTLFFELGTLAPFEVQTVEMAVKTNCDSILIDKSICLEAFADLDNPCTGLDPFSEVRLFSQCVNDTLVRFTLKNVGNAPTQGYHEYVIIEDEIIMRTNSFDLSAFGSMVVDVPTDGSTYRMEATKYDNGAQTATVRENCGGFTPGFVTAYWFDRGLRNYDFDCREINLAYDPNQKTAIPTGIGLDHLIEANNPLEYTIEFQNTGTDTAFRVLLIDILPPQVDINTFRPGFASHPYKWEINDARLEVLFSPIALPDSNVNEAASHGFFSFTVEQKPDLPNGTLLENTASIIFDYNPPIVTNTVAHQIGKLTVSVDESRDTPAFWQVLGNPARFLVTFQAKTFINGLKQFELTNAMGRIVATEQFEGQAFGFPCGNLPAGIYFFRIKDAQGKAFTGKIVVAGL